MLVILKKTCLLLSALLLLGLVKSRAQDTTTLFLQAAYDGKEKHIIEFLKNGVDVNISNSSNLTALMYAVEQKHKSLVKILLYNGADPNIRPYNGYPALHTAVTNEDKEITEELLQYNAVVDDTISTNLAPLHFACISNNLVLADMLIYYGAYPDQPSKGGMSPLHVASFYGSYKCAALLLDKGADPDKTDTDGNTPLMFAAQNGYIELTDLLLRNKADPGLKNNDSVDATGLALISGAEGTALFLLDKAPDPGKLLDTYSAFDIASLNDLRAVKEKLKSQNKHHSKAVLIDAIFFQYQFNFNGDDLMQGGLAGFEEKRYGLEASLGFRGRYGTTRIRIVEDNTLYQFREHRYMAFAGLYKLITLRGRMLRRLSLKAGIEGTQSWGDYRGSRIKAESMFIVSPYAGLKFSWKMLRFEAGYAYQDLKTMTISPHRFLINIGLGFKTRNLDKYLIDNVK